MREEVDTSWVKELSKDQQEVNSDEAESEETKKPISKLTILFQTDDRDRWNHPKGLVSGTCKKKGGIGGEYI